MKPVLVAAVAAVVMAVGEANAARALDAAFGTGGIVRVPGTGVGSLAVLPDGAIVAGIQRDGTSVLQRFASDGGLAGAVPLDAGTPPVFAVAPEGGLVTTRLRCDAAGCDVGVARVAADGAPDVAFGGDAVRVAAIPLDVSRVVRRADGRWLVGGAAGHAPRFVVWIARFTATGAPDAGFGDGGLVTVDFSSHGAALTGLVALADGTIVAGATGAASESEYASLLTFASDGSRRDAAALPFLLPAIAVAPGGDVVAVGNARDDAGGTTIAAARFGETLVLDTSFGGGLVRDPGGFASDVAVTADGAVVVAGGVGTVGAERFALLGLTSDGAPDGGFAAGGVVTVFPDEPSAAERVVVLPGGGLLAAGVVGADVALARLGGDGRTARPGGAGTTSTTAPAAGTTTTTTLAPCAGDGFAALACRCEAALGACVGPRGAAVRLRRACTLVAAAGGVPAGQSVGLLRRATRLFLRVDRHARAGARAADAPCATPARDLRRGARALLEELR